MRRRIALQIPDKDFVYAGGLNLDATKKFDTGGNEIWSFGVPNAVLSLSVDAAGNTYSLVDDRVYKTDAGGVQDWVTNGAPPACTDSCIDGNGNSFVSSRFGYIYKYNSSGTEVWNHLFSESFDNNCVAVDKDGFIIYGTSNSRVRKLNSAGTTVSWTNTSFGGGGIFALCVDRSKNIFGAGADGTVRKLNTSGALQWTFSGHTGAVTCVALDDIGNIYSGGVDGTVRKINAAGSQVWSFTGHSARIRGVALDADGNIYSGSDDGTLRKIDASGSEVWSLTWPNGGDVYSVAHPLALTISQDL